ncbi:centrosomal protein of 68 kDa isoform X2 [Embiotoca jacksoni]|uniref:centrosomal protein of 68 kDa isoform X2 n=1 Tax=Embiotoca jacksoni TaxID=100190 RepID=UPI003704627D
MEAEGCSQRWRLHHAELKHSRRSSSAAAGDGERGGSYREDRGGPHRSVTMATTCRYLTDRRYVTRKPLFSSEQQTSILKKTPPQRFTETDKQLPVSRREPLIRPREELSESFSLSHGDVSPPSSSREDLVSPSSVSELQARLLREEPALRSPFPGSRSAQRSLSSSVLEVQRLNPPLRPRLTSTVLHPTYTPRSGYSRPQLRPGGGREGTGGGENTLCSPESPHQVNYWACAIPKGSPPSPDRRSAGWDPNKEYRALLDYTYPLRPGQALSEWDGSVLQGDAFLRTDPHLQDSGIELDQLCRSTSLSGLDFSASGTGQTRGRSCLSAGQRSPDLQGFTRCVDGPPSSTPLSLTEPVGVSSDSLDCSQDTSSSTSTAVLCSTSVLPRSRCVCWEVDEEFRPLPEQLEELQLLSRQVREVTAQLSRPVTASWESLEPGTTSILSSVTLPEKQVAEEEEEEEEEKRDDEGAQRGREQRDADHTADHRLCETSSGGARAEPAGGGLSRSGLREVEDLVERLRGLTVAPDNQSDSPEEQEQRGSLMQHIQVFCSHLALLIQRLHAMSEKMELLAAPDVDIDSVKSSLAEYRSFQREVSRHQPLTSCVLDSGQLLLRCIDGTAPLLRDTLLLIERQSGALQNHTEHFFSSILSAMDSLTRPGQPGPARQSREEGPVGVRGSTY